MAVQALLQNMFKQVTMWTMVIWQLLLNLVFGGTVGEKTAVWKVEAERFEVCGVLIRLDECWLSD